MSPEIKIKASGKSGYQITTIRQNTPPSTTPQEPAPLQCPRCNSPNTKFCYYNNYSLTQPRHFCKTCRRYWTKGGTLRDIPVGGGCRKSKTFKPFPTLSSLSGYYLNFNGRSSFDVCVVKFLQETADSQLEGINNTDRTRNSHNSAGLFSQFSHRSDLSNACAANSSNPSFGLDPLTGFDFPLTSRTNHHDSTLSDLQEAKSMNSHSNLATDEYLQSVNQNYRCRKIQESLELVHLKPPERGNN